MGMGSSPLARGLQACLITPVPDHGIIPARAGFTWMGCSIQSHARDHPRSRGVYCFSCLIDDMGMGSSPLARGLLRIRIKKTSIILDHPRSRGVYTGLAHACDFEARIIPARAGFTDPISRPSATVRDHPRSRGVYRRHPGRVRVREGSSPLARGLPTPYRGPRRR